MAAANERDYLGHISPYLGSLVYDSAMYNSIDAEVNGEVLAYHAPSCEIQNCVETHLTDFVLVRRARTCRSHCRTAQYQVQLFQDKCKISKHQSVIFACSSIT